MGHKQYAFVFSTGRCGTTSLGILLQYAKDVLALNEGQYRDEFLGGEQVLKAMTLQNLQAYKEPGKAQELFNQARTQLIPDVMKQFGKSYFIELSYFLAPFVQAVQSAYPGVRMLYIHRDGRDFVRSAYTSEVPDPAPVGYVDERPLHPVERFVSMGRLLPSEGTEDFRRWPDMTTFEKNVWLWAETNRIILTGFVGKRDNFTHQISMEHLFTSEGMEEVFDFLKVKNVPRQAVDDALNRKINTRKRFLLPPWSEWDPDLKRSFKTIGQDMLHRLGYAENADW